MSLLRPSATRARRLRSQVPQLAAGLARSAHSGATLVAALDEAAAAVPEPSASALAGIGRAVARGVPVERALQQWADSEQVDELTLVVTAACLGHRHGGELSVALDAAALAVSDRAEVADEARALSTQARTSAAVLVALPPFGAACFCLLDPSVARTLFLTPLGWGCLVAGVLLDGAGAAVMARMVRGALR